MARKRLRTRALFLSLLMSLATIPMIGATSETITVPANNNTNRSVRLDKGDKISGSVTVTGGTGNDFVFQIQDPTYGVVETYTGTTSASFSFNAKLPGSYLFIFDNEFSSQGSKQISFNYNIEKPLIPGLNAGGIPEFPMEMILAGSILAIIVLLIWRKRA